ncbi:MAG TPA: beta-propeller fold lactonase family protein [Polyangia bacterium]|jgi:hypothetical protein|nr:beta-propeller fold lactonase family protein [Polyangia bacterium]
MKTPTNRRLPGLYRLLTLGCALGLVGAACGDKGPKNSYIYVLTNPDGPNAVEAYRRNVQTGQLERLGRYPTGGTGDSLVAGYQQQALVTDNNRLYAVNPGSDSVSAFAIEDNGALRLLNTLPSGGRRPASLTLRNNLLYVANTGHAPIEDYAAASYKGFRVQADGSLAELSCPVVDATGGTLDGGPVASISAIVLNQDATMLATAGLLPNLIETFRVDSAGCLQDRLTFPGGGGPYGANFTPTSAGEQRFYVTIGRPENFSGERAPGVAEYRVGPANQLTLLGSYTDPDTSDAGLRDPCWVIFTANAQRFWTSSFIPRAINLFERNGTGGITRVSTYNPNDTVPDPSNPPGPPFPVGSTDIMLEPNGRFFYQLRVLQSPDGLIPVVPFLVAFEVTGNWTTNAGLREIQRLEMPSDLAGAGVTGLALANR